MPGPLLITANHPNSFLDAIIIGSLFYRPIHFLARGDAFHKPWHAKLLRLLNMIPVYRLTEGRENLMLNERAFERSKEVLQSNGIVLIFIEGICVNKNEPQPFKKGAARIAMENRNLAHFQILPVAMAYDSFQRFGKSVDIHISDPKAVKTFFTTGGEAKDIRYFNSVLYEEIAKQVHIPRRRKHVWRPMVFLPAMTGYLTHFLLYMPVKKIVRNKTRGTVFFDSVLFGALFLTYPVYLLLVFLLGLFIGLPMFFSATLFVLLPFFAWCAIQYRG